MSGETPGLQEFAAPFFIPTDYLWSRKPDELDEVMMERFLP